jgi:hypothetical protein
MRNGCRIAGTGKLIYLTMNRSFLTLFLFLGVLGGYSQQRVPSGYMDSIKAFRADYIQTHELLTAENKKAAEIHRLRGVDGT